MLRNELYDLFNRYGSLYTIHVKYWLKLSNNKILVAKLRQQFHELRLIEQQVISDGRLLTVLFKFEGDGQQGCLLNCILIYAAQAIQDANKLLRQLEQLSVACAHNVKLEFQNWGQLQKENSGIDAYGFIHDTDKLELFCLMIAGLNSYYDSYPLKEHDGEFIHEKVTKPWTLSISSQSSGMKPRLMKISEAELIDYTSNPEKVWCTKVLPIAVQKRLEIDRTVLTELSCELDDYVKEFNKEILYCLQVFYTFLHLGNEPFFYLEKFKDMVTEIKPSQLGCQLIYLFKFLCQQPALTQQLLESISFLEQRLQLFLQNQVWLALKQLSQRGSEAIADVETLQKLNLLRLKHEPDQLSARMPGFDISGENSIKYTESDFAVFQRRTKDAEEYLESLLKQDQLICRFKFYAEVGDASFLEERETFSAHFTEFLRIHKRSALLKDLNGYFLIWSNKFIQHQFQKQKVEPFVDIVFLIEPSYGFCFSSFEQNLISAWGNFQGKNSLSSEHERHFRSNGLVSVNLMNSEELLTSILVNFEKRNKRLKKVLLEKLLPYFTYRHFYLPKFYDVKKNKKIKMFSKGQPPKKLN